MTLRNAVSSLVMGGVMLACASLTAQAQCIEQKPSAEMLAHLDAMKTSGWKAIHETNRLPMLGCAVGAHPRDCLRGVNADGSEQFPSTSGSAFSAGWNKLNPNAAMRFLNQSTESSSYWIRTSPDGRFVGLSRRILDLAPVAQGRPVRRISTNAPYDPAFFPDGSGINYAGGDFCPMSLLLNESLTQLNFNEPGCTSINSIPLYQSLGTGLNGTDYVAAAGPFAGDSGDQFGESRPNWLGSGVLRLYSMVLDGTGFQLSRTQSISTPTEADWQIAPSSEFISARVAARVDGQVVQSGFEMSLLKRVAGSDQYTKIPGARICDRGSKATFSYEERYLTYHRGVRDGEFAEYGFSSATDPAFREMVTRGTVNIFVHDFMTGTTKRLTHMSAGQAALFPSFRADGWLYFLVKDRSQGQYREHVVASSQYVDARE